RVSITPYNENLDKVCSQISDALESIEQDLNKKGIKFDQKLLYILREGPAHEKSHQEAYINYIPDSADGRREYLREGRSALGGWVNFSVELEIQRQGDTIVAGMSVGLPHLVSLDEAIHVYLAPEKPSLGDTLFTATEIFRYLDTNSPLYNEVLETLTDVCIELNIFNRERS
ncbi:MAG: hypothetical protein Q9M91_06240, partial [Candidatus Dojkabacteria bacterium]|nr:hypothetical protein [Candidatus Dojkabacteria bacterium]